MNKLSDKQAETLRYIITFSRENDYQPSYREMADHFEVSLNAISDRIKTLIKKGYIERAKNTARRLKILKNTMQ